MNLDQIDATMWTALGAGISAALLIGLVLLRTLTDGKAEVKLTDAAIALIPIVIVLFATGKISKLVVGPEGVTVESAGDAILTAVDRSVDAQVSIIDPEPVDAAGKGGIALIPEYLARGLQALTFEIGLRYVPEIMATYFRELTKSPRFRYVVLLEPGGERFFGIVDAGKLVSLVAQRSGRRDPFEADDWKPLRDMIDQSPQDFLELPGFIGMDMALSVDVTKRDALARLEEADLDWLPAVSGDGRFAGIIERSRLTASLILDVAAQLETAREEAQ